MLVILTSRPSLASVVTVPDAFPTVQAAINSRADTVLIREGSYPEVPQTHWGVTLRGVGQRRPQLEGLLISNAFGESARKWRISDIDFSGSVDISTDNVYARGIQVDFKACALSLGLRHVLRSDIEDIELLSFSHCMLRGASDALARSVVMESDTIDAGARWVVFDTLTVRDCWFRGGAGIALDIVGDGLAGSIDNNLIEEYATGIILYDASGMAVTANTIRHITGDALYVPSSRAVTVSRNLISDCGFGVRTRADQVTAAGNTVLRCELGGFSSFQPDYLRAERNVVGLCGVSAFSVSVGFDAVLAFMGNTLFSNNGSGIDILGGTSSELVVQNNIVANNAGWGLRMPTNEFLATLGCNDWFGNALGSVTGAQADTADLEVDPGFCDISSWDVTLFSDSPLVTQSACGQIGACGVGCSPPILKMVSVASSRAGLGVAWEFQAASPVQSWIERADQPSGPWDSLGTGTPRASNSFELLDAAVAPDHPYHYRVAWRDRGAVVRGTPMVGSWTDAGTLSSVYPNPAFGEVVVDWVLSRSGATHIRVYDLVGREVSVIARGSYDVGRHQVRWDGRWEGRGGAPAGMYIVRISSGERTTSHRTLLLR